MYLSDDYQPALEVLENTIAGMLNDEPSLAGKRVLERELERHQKKPNGPKSTAKDIEAKQNWINRGSKRIETESAKLGEMQENLRVRKNLQSCLRGDQDSPRRLVARGRIDGQNRSHNMSPESTEENRNLEQQDLNLSRGSASRRLAAWTRDGSTEEIASWTVEAQRLQKSGGEEEKTLRGDRERIHNERRQDVGRRLGWSGWISVVVKVQTRILNAISESSRFAEWKEFGTVKCCGRPCVFEIVAARMFEKVGWSERWCKRTIQAVRTHGGTAMPSSHHASDGVDKQKLLVERVDGLQSSWMDR